MSQIDGEAERSSTKPDSPLNNLSSKQIAQKNDKIKRPQRARLQTDKSARRRQDICVLKFYYFLG